MSVDVTLLGSRVRERRRHAGLSQEVAAAKAGLDASYWSQLEGGKYQNPGLVTIRKIADVLGTSMAYLVGDSDDPRPKPIHIERRDMPLPPPGWEKLSEEERKEVEERARAYEEFEIRRILRERGYDV